MQFRQKIEQVSTHSRLKAAGEDGITKGNKAMFQHTAA